MAKSKRKIAIVLIHGIGDQRPMDNLRAFTEAMLSRFPKPADRPLYWSKPDRIAESFEMRRLNAYPGGGRAPVDFYEFYWAHFMEGNTLSHLGGWITRLLFRWPTSVPLALRKLWYLIWITLVAAAILLYIFREVALLGLLGTLGGIALLVVKSGVSRLLRDWVGDAARYLNPNPTNVDIRNRIRKAGVDMLAKLHESGEYRRIVVVGHSLGSVIALDILYYYWINAREQHALLDEVKQTALKELEQAVRGNPQMSVTVIRELQKTLAKELRDLGVAWNISDLVTLGSPLTHLPFLLGLTDEQFAERLIQRELPKCPPVLDEGSLSYPVPFTTQAGNRRSIHVLHHAACFAPTRWTNIYFPSDGWFKGDPVGGRLSTLFGHGIDDIEVRTRHLGGRLNHVDYWRIDPRDPKDDHNPVDRLLRAIALDE